MLSDPRVLFHLQVYWLGPCLGGTLASTFFNYVFNYTNPRNDEEPELEPVDALLDPNQNTEFWQRDFHARCEK